LLLVHLRQSGYRALALKPFCTGSRTDAQFLHKLQDAELTLDQINPFYFPEPLAPLVAARIHHRKIALPAVLRHIRGVAAHLACPPIQQSSILLVEGAGGLLVPLGANFSWAEVLKKLACEVIIVAANRLGTINHTLLTVRALQTIGVQQLNVVLMGILAPRQAAPDTRHNTAVLAKLLAPIPVLQIPFLGRKPLENRAIKKNQKKIKKVLARILA
jgi:dethiobiotin synthetase